MASAARRVGGLLRGPMLWAACPTAAGRAMACRSGCSSRIAISAFPRPLQYRSANTRAEVTLMEQRMQQQRVNTNENQLSPQAMAKAHRESTAAQRNMFLLPGIIAPLPFRQWPRELPKLRRYLYLRLRQLFICISATWQLRLSSIPGGSIRPRFKVHRRRIIPAAKGLHRRMNEAIAAGDLETLREVCHRPLYNLLARAIQTRPKGTAIEWEVVSYNRPLFFPRITLQRAMRLQLGDEIGAGETAGAEKWAQHSAIVTLETTQKLTRWDKATEMVVPGGVRAENKRENVLLMRCVNMKTWEPEPWKIWGMEDGKTLEEWEEYEGNMDALQEHEFKERMEKLGLAKGGKKPKK